MAERAKEDEEKTMMSTSSERPTAPNRLGARTRLALAALALLALAAIAGPGAGQALAKTGIKTWSITPTSSQAGGHPDVELHTTFYNRSNPPSDPCNCDDARIIRTRFPTGFIGNPHAIPQCTLSEFGTSDCPSEAQVGIAVFLAGLQVPVYNMEPHADQAGLLAFKVPLVEGPAFIELNARTDSDYGLDATSSPIFHLLPIESLDMYLWGVPALPIHDANRWPSPQPPICRFFAPYPEPCFAPVSSEVPPVPYLQNPTNCGETLTAGLDLEYYTHVEDHAEAPWPSTTGCDQLSFNPSLTALPTTEQADTASGLDVSLKVPQVLNPTTPSPSEIKALTVTLPEGFSINPNAADGKRACSDQEAAFKTLLGAHCPESSKVGTATLESSALPGPITGAIYLGQPLPGNRYRLFLTADGFATHVKLAGTVRPNPQTGQLAVSFGADGTESLPQSPFSRFDMHFFGSERGLLATPTQCGTYPIESEFTPWDSALPHQFSTSSFTIDSGPDGKPCPAATRPFNPALTAGTVDNTAAKHSPFLVKVSRADGDQNITGIDVATPPGFSATLAGIPYCPEAAIAKLDDPSYSGLAETAAPACPAASQIGTANAGTGAGTHPLYSPGKVYLAGPYKGAQLSLVVVIPAVSGPYDLGNVVVRSAVGVNPVTAQISTVSDPIPTILDGIPLRLRSVLISLDRPDFTLNPTNCEPSEIGSRVLGSQGAVATVPSHFQVANCSDLGFAPKLSLHLSGGIARHGHPALRAVVRTKPGEANFSRVQVTLPHGEQVDNAHFNNVCTRPQLAQGACPASSIYGHAEAATPLLGQPLVGNVYLVTGFGHKLPDLVADLHGQIDIQLHGRISAFKQALRTTFEGIPDAPVSSFTLSMLGGKKGLLVNSKGICSGVGPAKVAMRGQNNRRSNRKVKLQASCGKHAKRAKRNLHSRRGA
jgi:hypothetical protein